MTPETRWPWPDAVPTEAAVTFLIADISGYTALTEAHGSLRAAAVVRRFLEMARASLQPTARLLERVGDSVLIAAPDASAAVRTAIALRAAAEAERFFPPIRQGVHGGPVIEWDGSYFGTPLNLTARLAGHAGPGQILCTERVAQAASELGSIFRSVGVASLKNIREPVTLVEVVTPDRQLDPELLDPICWMQVQRPAARELIRIGSRTYHFCSTECAEAFAERHGVERDR
jgi:class 3 adenylate cyclase/YHS domain-containing protein